MFCVTVYTVYDAYCLVSSQGAALISGGEDSRLCTWNLAASGRCRKIGCVRALGWIGARCGVQSADAGGDRGRDDRQSVEGTPTRTARASTPQTAYCGVPPSQLVRHCTVVTVTHDVLTGAVGTYWCTYGYSRMHDFHGYSRESLRLSGVGAQVTPPRRRLRTLFDIPHVLGAERQVTF